MAMKNNRVRLKSIDLNRIMMSVLVVLVCFLVGQSEASRHHHQDTNKRHDLVDERTFDFHDRHHASNKNSEYAMPVEGERSLQEAGGVFKDLHHRKHRSHRSHNLVVGQHQDQYDYNGHRRRTYDDSSSKRDIIKHTSSDVATTAGDSSNSNQANDSNSVQRDYMAAVIGKDVQLDCRMKNLASDDDNKVINLINFKEFIFFKFIIFIFVLDCVVENA